MNARSDRKQLARVTPPLNTPRVGRGPLPKSLVAQLKGSARRPIAPLVYEPKPLRPIAQANTAVPSTQRNVLGRILEPLTLHSAFRPQAKQESIQAKLTALPRVMQENQRLTDARSNGVRLNRGPLVQCKKGNKGGKGGITYSSLRLTYSQAEIDIAMGEIGLAKGVKGHGKGASGSGESGQTQQEMQRLVAQLQKNRKKGKKIATRCRQFHKRVNRGATCPSCRAVVS
jgi:hypothetical protein